MEQWKPIEGYEGRYEVSSYGRIKSLKRLINKFLWGKYVLCLSKEKILALVPDHNGYFRIVLCKDGITKGYSVSRLVATAFLDNPNNYPCVLHNDDNPKNNNVDNLEWNTQKKNQQDGALRGRFGAYNKGKFGELASASKAVLQKDIQGNVINDWACAREAHRDMGVCYKKVSAACIGGKPYKGFIWEFKNSLN